MGALHIVLPRDALFHGRFQLNSKEGIYGWALLYSSVWRLTGTTT